MTSGRPAQAVTSAVSNLHNHLAQAMKFDEAAD